MWIMANPDSTCWTLIRAAAAGSPSVRDAFARQYLGVVRVYLAARWRGSTLWERLDDATQEVFVECFRGGGVLEAVGDGRVSSFRAFLYGVVRNVARRFESRAAHLTGPLPAEIDANEASQSQLFDRAWAQAIMGEAAHLQRERATARGPRAIRRVELLRLRFEENLPIRSIAERWGVDVRTVHHEYALARQEFRAALLEVVGFHSPGSLEGLDQEVAGLLKALS
jgi:RNA polymerase sigma factor (sigma-70 family)